MLQRHLEPVLLESLRHFPVVLLTGARQVGKSTLVQEISRKAWPARYLTLDDRAVLDAALTDPDGFARSNETPVVFDEVQRAPDLLRAVKLVVDRERRPGRFLLTGSANILTLTRVSETLAGRAAVHELHPLSWAEIESKPPPSTLDDLFSAQSSAEICQRWPRRSTDDDIREIHRRILRGGFPTPASLDPDRARRTWFESYRQTYLERDLRDLANVAHLPDFSRLLATVALRTGKILNVAELSRDVGLKESTLRRYLNLLCQTYQVSLLPPYAANVAKRLVKAPKVYMLDTGLACHLSAADRWDTLVRQNRAGAMLETFVGDELRKVASVSRARTDLYYWRTREGEEVDFLLERGDEVVGIEVKSAARIAEQDLAALRGCRRALASRWRFGILAYGGAEVVTLDDRTLAVPFAVLLGRD